MTRVRGTHDVRRFRAHLHVRQELQAGVLMSIGVFLLVQVWQGRIRTMRMFFSFIGSFDSLGIWAVVEEGIEVLYITFLLVLVYQVYSRVILGLLKRRALILWAKRSLADLVWRLCSWLLCLFTPSLRCLQSICLCVNRQWISPPLAHLDSLLWVVVWLSLNSMTDHHVTALGRPSSWIRFINFWLGVILMHSGDVSTWWVTSLIARRVSMSGM